MDYEMNSEPGKYNVEGFSASSTLIRGPEAWQFFAFVFGATLAFILSLIDSVVAIIGTMHAPTYGLAATILFGMADAYLVLFNPQMRNTLATWLGIWKQEN